MSASTAVLDQAVPALAALALPLAELALRATTLLALGFLAERMLRRAPAAARHAVWVATFAGLALLPLLRPVLPGVALPVLPEALAVNPAEGSPRGADGDAGSEVRSAAMRSGEGPGFVAAAPPDATLAERSAAGAGRAIPDGAPPAGHERRSEAAMPRPGEKRSWLAAFTVPKAGEVHGAAADLTAAAVVALALAGTILVFAYLLLGILASWVFVRRARPLDADPPWRALLDRAVAEQRSHRRPALALSGSVGVPLLCGLLRPTILLPSAAAGWSEEERRRVLAHEVAHAARRDGLLQVAARAVTALFWWHPLAWRALARLVLAAELSCDDRVLAGGAGGPEYARQLLDLARPRGAAQTMRPAPRPMAVAMARRADLAVRIRALLDETRPRGPLPRLATVGAAAAVVAAATLLAPVRLGAADSDWADTAGSGASTVLWSSVGERLDRAWVRDSIGRQRHRMTPLMRAAFAGDHAEVRRLLDGGADPDRQVFGLGTALILAADAGDAELVDLLLDHDADPNRTETGGERPGDLQRSPLGSAARSGDLGTVERLLAAGADVDAAPSGDGTPLMNASRYGYVPLVRRLLDAGADPDAVIRGDGTPLIEAARNGHLEVVEMLLAAGAPPDTAVGGDGNPLIVAAAEGHREVLDSLLEAGADPDVWVPGDESALYHAIERGDEWMVQWLIEAGADVSGRWPDEDGPLELAVESGNPRIMEILRQAGARR